MGFKIDDLYYEIDARTTGFENNVMRAKQTADDFANFIKGKPLLAVASFAASLVAIGTAAAKMANDVDVSVRRVTAAFPDATNEVERLRNSIAEISKITPRSQAELADAAAAIAEKGAESVAEIQQRLRTAVDLADATGADLVSIVDGLDLVGDAFSLTANQAADALTRIFGAAQGKVGIEEVFTVLEKGGSVLASLGVEAADAGEAMIALIDAGVPRKQAGSVLTTILELTSRVRALKAAGGEQAEVGRIIEATLSRQNVQAKGLTGAFGDFATATQRAGKDLSEYGIRANIVNAIQRVAAAAAADTRSEAEKLADAQQKLQQAAKVNRESASALATILRNELADSLIRLGNDILPVVIRGIESLTNVVRRLKGEGNPLRDIETLSGAIPTGAALGAHALRRGTRFETADEKSAGAFRDAFNSTVTRATRYGADAFAGFTPDKLQSLSENLKKYIDLNYNNDVVTSQFTSIGRMMSALDSALAAAKVEGGTGTPTGTGNPAGALAGEIQKAIDALRRSVAQTLAGETETRIDDARERVAAFRAEVAKLEEQSGKRLTDLRAEADRLASTTTTVEAKERAAAAKSVAGEVASAIGLQSRIMEQGLADFLSDVEKRNAEYAKLGLAPLFSADQVDKVREIRQALIDATKAAEDTDKALTASRSYSDPTSGRPNLLAASGVISAQIAKLEAQRDATPTGEAGLEKRRRIQYEINKLQGEQNALIAKNDAVIKTGNDDLDKRTRAMQEQAAALVQSVSLVLQLGTAFGIVNAQTASILTNIAAGAQGVGPFMAALSSFRKGGEGATSLGGLVSAAVPVVGGIAAAAGLLSQFFGESAAEKERRRLLAVNNEALDRLTKSVGDLARINVTGASASTFAGLLADPRAQRPNLGGGSAVLDSDAQNRLIGDLIRSSGTTAEALRDFAKQFGLEIGATNGDRFTFDDLDALRKALSSSELTTFGDTIGGQLQSMQAEINLFDIKDPIRQFELLRKAIAGVKDGGGILQRTLDTFDTSTQEGLQAAQDALQGLFRQLQAGTLSVTDLGGLTAQEFLDNLTKASALLRSGASAVGGTGGYNVDRTITEATGSHLAGLMATGNYHAERTATAVETILGLLRSVITPAAIVPPSLALFGAAGAAASNVGDEVTFQFNVTVAIPPELVASAGFDQATAIGRQIGDGAAQAMSESMAKLVRRRRQANGDTLLS